MRVASAIARAGLCAPGVPCSCSSSISGRSTSGPFACVLRDGANACGNAGTPAWPHASDGDQTLTSASLCSAASSPGRQRPIDHIAAMQDSWGELLSRQASGAAASSTGWPRGCMGDTPAWTIRCGHAHTCQRAGHVLASTASLPQLQPSQRASTAASLSSAAAAAQSSPKRARLRMDDIPMFKMPGRAASSENDDFAGVKEDNHMVHEAKAKQEPPQQQQHASAQAPGTWRLCVTYAGRRQAEQSAVHMGTGRAVGRLADGDTP